MDKKIHSEEPVRDFRLHTTCGLLVRVMRPGKETVPGKTSRTAKTREGVTCGRCLQVLHRRERLAKAKARGYRSYTIASVLP